MKKFWNTLGTTEIRNILAIITVIGSFAALLLMLFKPIPAANKDTVNLTIGFVLGTGIGAVMGFYFGASKKDEKPTT